ncbi:MAG: hypothetical protein A3C58_01740 [Candidatus Staskawiczbacteria bacterium RIFCSPHIGHO2_02_FULL_34_10]|uniref:DUF1508 domain-containing protein n=2 Tax=Candidatus Staskawicziibacteriota TaxID=1817916 RepID=A0A1G2HLF7_9BACT|nr:MAG: hypothetical protein A2639_02270 [Candidatus Staskawiczbacteria bacterium RIFCSPHIGHO2_01_FULL_34_27]OGZ66246.1 MAG: hypothetical protein A3C58_01740 [Candidatus Staskawiczbacteria bacterium RIFCSPHIGHO2_02_FULL_34_10]
MRFVIYRDVIGQYRWRCRAGGNNEIIAVSEGYKQKSSAENAIALIMRYAHNAEIVDLTKTQQKV